MLKVDRRDRYGIITKEKTAIVTRVVWRHEIHASLKLGHGNGAHVTPDNFTNQNVNFLTGERDTTIILCVWVYVEQTLDLFLLSCFGSRWDWVEKICLLELRIKLRTERRNERIKDT